MRQKYTIAALLCFAQLPLLAACSFEQGNPSETQTSASMAALFGCDTPAEGTGSICDLGNGAVLFQVTLPSNQMYVELFSRQNGVQNVAAGIGANVADNGDGTSTYYLQRGGYSEGDSIEYRFYSYLPNAPGVFTPGPAEQNWYSTTYGSTGGSEDIPVLKDATLILSSYGYGYVPDDNFGANTTVDTGSYHHTAKGLLGYSLSAIPASASVTKAEIVVPSVSSPNGPNPTIALNDVTNSSSWQEMTVTWNTAPAATYFDDFTLDTTLVNRLDVTSLVADAVADGDSEVSFLISYVNSNVFIASKESTTAQPTYLHVEYD